MKRLLILLTLLIGFLFNGNAQVNPNSIYIEGYYRKDGTYVQGHYRTLPNNTINDNYTTKPNINPYTGKAGTITPSYQYNTTPKYYYPSYGDEISSYSSKAPTFYNRSYSVGYESGFYHSCGCNTIPNNGYLHQRGSFSDGYDMGLLKGKLFRMNSRQNTISSERKKPLYETKNTIKSSISKSREAKRQTAELDRIIKPFSAEVDRAFSSVRQPVLDYFRYDVDTKDVADIDRNGKIVPKQNNSDTIHIIVIAFSSAFVLFSVILASNNSSKEENETVKNV